MTKLVLLLFIFISLNSFSKTYVLNAPQGGDFKIAHLDTKELRGKNIFLLFGFTSCQSLCPLALNKLKEVKAKISEEERKNTEVIFISVDNINDNKKNVQNWVSAFDKSFIGTTTNDKELKNILSLFGARYYRIKTKNNRILVDHSTDIFLINKKGIWADTLSFNSSAEEIKAALDKSHQIKNHEERFPKSKSVELLSGRCNLTLKDCKMMHFKARVAQRPIKVQNQFSIEITTLTDDLVPVEADFEGIEAYMGLIRPTFKPSAEKSYVTQLTLPVCEFKKMNWRVTIILKDKNDKYYAQQLELTTDS